MNTNTSLDPSRRRFLKTASAAVTTLGGIAALEPRVAAQRIAPNGAAHTDVVVYLYDRMTALDAIGPYEVLRCAPGVRVRFAAKRPGLVRTDSRLQMLNAEYGIDEVTSADVLVIPGGDVSGQINDPAVLDWIRRMNETTKWTTSACVGALILGAAGLLKGIQATTHWNFLDALRDFGAEPVSRRFVRAGKIVTAAGVSAGIDMALELVALTHGEDTARMVQLIVEHDPQPPFDSGSRRTASVEQAAAARQRLIEIYAQPKEAL